MAIAMDAQQGVLNDLLLALDVGEPVAHEGSHDRRDLGQQGLVGEAIAVLCRSHELREPVVEVLQRCLWYAAGEASGYTAPRHSCAWTGR